LVLSLTCRLNSAAAGEEARISELTSRLQAPRPSAAASTNPHNGTKGFFIKIKIGKQGTASYTVGRYPGKNGRPFSK
jgi:hypothetical protein